jgi:hypothetical protein
MAFSRVSLAERFLVLGAAILASGGMVLLAHPSLGEFLLIQGLPVLLTSWTLGLCLVRKSSPLYRGLVLVGVLWATCAAFTLLRAEGMGRRSVRPPLAVDSHARAGLPRRAGAAGRNRQATRRAASSASAAGGLARISRPESRRHAARRSYRVGLERRPAEAALAETDRAGLVVGHRRGGSALHPGTGGRAGSRRLPGRRDRPDALVARECRAT